jgi:hypothetical protein
LERLGASKIVLKSPAIEDIGSLGQSIALVSQLQASLPERKNTHMNRITVDLKEITNSCFVIMPFHALYEAQYEQVIKPAIQESGLSCVRGDEIFQRQAVIQDIWIAVRTSRVVVAELSGRNPNVMYEIGLAHALGKPIILITRNEDDVPFDLRSLRYIFYDLNDPFWGQNLRRKLTQIIRQVLDNPNIADHLEDVTVEAGLPAVPDMEGTATTRGKTYLEIGGVWHGKWLSIRREREHTAVLSIPSGHDTNFTASMTVSYIREGQQTIVLETMTGNISETKLFLTGVNYTYIQKGSSAIYSLDNFELVTEGKESLIGKAVLRHGIREVTFTRAPS